MDKTDIVLKKNNLRMTPQRKAILQLLKNCRGHHLEAENIYELLAGKNNNSTGIGLATIYRALDLFVKIGVVSKLSMENAPSRYELINHEGVKHHHLICLECGQVEEIEDELTERFSEMIQNKKAFYVADKPMKIYGYCKRCKNTKSSYSERK